MFRNCAGAVCVVAVACAPVRADEPKPAVKTFAFHMKDAKWDEVFAAYEKLSGQSSGPFGTVTPHKNSLLVQDTASNVSRIKELLDDNWPKK